MKTPNTITHIPLAELVPYAANARTHSDAQVAQIAASMREFGWTNPVLVDVRRTIIAGHGRVLAARKLGLDTVPCIVIDHLTDTQRRALVLADNQLALNARWDEALLSAELSRLLDDDFSLPLLGFDDGLVLRLTKDAPVDLTEPESSASEVDVDGFQLEAKCPRCGFEFDPK